MSDTNFSRGTSANSTSSRSRMNRLSVAAFVTDTATEFVLRDGLSDLVPEGVDIRRGSVRSAITSMMRMPTPELLIIDISGQDYPLQVLSELCDVIEPATRLLVLGDTDDVDTYRQIVQNAGAIDYIFKPITLEMIGRQLAPLITRQSMAGDSSRGGRVIAVTGARGGVGASMVAASLAWHLGVESNRHTVLVDADVHSGIMSDLFNAKTEFGLNEILNCDNLVSSSLIQDQVHHLNGRLNLLPSQLSLNLFKDNYIFGNAKILIDALRLQYNFIIFDIPYLPVSSHREISELVHHQIIVFDASLVGLRDTIRLLGLSGGPKRLQRPTLILNRAQKSGNLRLKQIEEGLKRKVDMSITDVSRQLGDTHSAERFPRLQRSSFGRSIAGLSRELGFDNRNIIKIKPSRFFYKRKSK